MLAASTATATACLVSALLAAAVVPAHGGNCWSGMSRGGRCTDLLQEKVTREQCCALASGASGAAGAAASTAWSEKDMDPGMMFFWRVLGGGVPCQACRDTCAGVSCGPGRRCAVRWGRPQCVCAPDCSRPPSGKSRGKPRPRGPVCGTDGRSYRSACRLLKRACRRKNSNLSIAYHGTCQTDSCERVQCGEGRSCVQDQNLTPHCVHCERRCPSAGLGRAAVTAMSTSTARGSARGSARTVCGADGTSYPSACHLREAACRAGKAIPVAYRGRCQRASSCGAIHCRRHQSCLMDLATGSPRCVTCNLRCPRGPGGKGAAKGGKGAGRRSGRRRAGLAAMGNAMGTATGSIGARVRELVSMDAATELVQGGPICGSNNRTYLSWCHMRKDACATGYVIDTHHPGACGAAGHVSGDDDEDDDDVKGHDARSGAGPATHLNTVLEGNNAFP